MIWLNILALILVAVLAWILYYKSQNNNATNSTVASNSGITNSWIVNELITKNYNKQVHSLNLSSKWLSEMPDICAMVKWTKYEYDIWSLDIADNWFANIDKDLSCLKNLSELNLSFNKITKIENLDKLTFLKKLDLWNNELTSISWLDSLSNLIDLHLWYNKIVSTKWLEKLKNLKSLKLQNNKINDLSWIFWLSLIELKMEYNQLTDSNLKQIPYIDKLKIITVAENKISKNIVEKYNEITRKNM